MVGQAGHVGRRRASSARLARLSRPPAGVIPRGEERESRLQVLQLLAEAICQAVEPLEEKPLRAVEPLDVRRAYREDFPLVHPAPGRSLGSNHFAGRVDHRGVAELLDYDAILGVWTEGQVNGFGV